MTRSTSLDPLRDPRLKIERAKTHLSDLESRLIEIFDPDNGTCAIVTEIDTAHRQKIYKLVLRRDIGSEIAIVMDFTASLGKIVMSSWSRSG